MFNSLQPYDLQPTRLLCPWDSPSNNTGVGCYALIQGIFPTQGSNPPSLPALAGRFFTTSATWEVLFLITLSKIHSSPQFSSVTQSCPTLQPHGLQHTRLPCPSPTPRAYSNSCPSCPSCWWCHPTISSSVIPLYYCLQSFPTSRFFPMNAINSLVLSFLYSPTLTSIHDYWKTIALTRQMFVGKLCLCFLICYLGLSQLFFQGANIF